MIYRSWSLLTGSVSICGGIVAALVVTNFLVFKEDPFLKPEINKYESAPSSK